MHDGWPGSSGVRRNGACRELFDCGVNAGEVLDCPGILLDPASVEIASEPLIAKMMRRLATRDGSEQSLRPVQDARRCRCRRAAEFLLPLPFKGCNQLAELAGQIGGRRHRVGRSARRLQSGVADDELDHFQSIPRKPQVFLGRTPEDPELANAEIGQNLGARSGGSPVLLAGRRLA